MDSRRQALIGIGSSLLLHGALAVFALAVEPTRTIEQEPVPLRLVDREPPPPPPEPDIEPEPPKVEPPPPPEEPPKPKIVRKPKKRPKKTVEPPPEPPPPPPRGAPPAYGIKLENTVTAAPGTGIPIPVGDTLATEPTGPGKPTDKPPGVENGEGEGEIKTVPRARIQVMPKLVSDSVAAYPAEIRKLGLQGRVVLELIINGKGRVIRKRVVRPLHPVLDKAALAAASGLRFDPGTLDGVPVKVKIPYTYVFVLE